MNCRPLHRNSFAYLGFGLIVGLVAGVGSAPSVAEEPVTQERATEQRMAQAPKLTGQFELKAPIGGFEHQVPDCSLIHFHLPEPPPEGQMFQMQMLTSQSQMSGSRIMVAGFVGADDAAKGTFAYRDAQDRQWLPGGESLDNQQALTLSLDGKSFNQWVARADRTKTEYLVDLSFSTTTPLSIFSNTGIQPVGEVTANYQGQCTVSIPWLPAGMDLQ